MSTPDERGNHDARLDEALRAIAGHEDQAVDLRARVMAAIDASEVTRSTRRRASQVGQGFSPARTVRRAFAWPGFARPAFALAGIAVVAIAVAVWLAGRPVSAPVHVDTGTTSSAVPPNQAAASPRAAQAGGERLPPGAEPGAQQAAGRRARALERRPTRGADQPTAIAALPPLDAPEPLEIERLEGPPLTVARLEIDGLAFEPLDVKSLDSVEKE